MQDTLIDRLRGRVPELTVLEREPMSRHTSFQIGGPADLFLAPHSVAQLKETLSVLHEFSVLPLFLGNGTNLLVSDRGIRGVVLSTAELKGLALEEGGCVRAAAGETMAHAAVFARDCGLSGLEFAHGIPGTVGGGLCMNAGAYGGELKHVVREALCVDGAGKVFSLRGEALRFGYRQSVFHESPGVFALEAVFALAPGNREEIGERMRDLMKRRKTSQPLELPSAGSVFKRPEGYFAGTLIEQAGLKGARVGGAQVSPKHAGFIVNTGGATCGHVLTLIAYIQNTVLKQFGVLLEPEIRPIGEF